MTDEISRAERARQERLAEKPKDTEKPKEGPSQFDKILEESKSVQRGLPMQQTTQKLATEQAVKEAYKREDRGKEDEEKEKKDKDGKKDQGGQEKKGDGKDAGLRVISKSFLKDGRGGQGGRGGRGMGQDKKGVSTTQFKDISKSIGSTLHGRFAEKLQATIAKKVSEPQLSQAILNKLVQYVRIGINKMGDKEMQIDLHEKIYKGLKLRVTSREGKVGVHFISADANARSIFEKNKDAIRDALEKKGILVEDILVT